MKRPSYFLTGLAVAMMALVVYVSAQTAVSANPPSAAAPKPESDQLPVDTNKLVQGMALFRQGQFKEAEDLLAHIRKYNKSDTRDPDYATALCYEALCRHALKNWSGYLKAMESPWIQTAELAPELREELDSKRIGALFYCRVFEDLLARTTAFSSEHPDSRWAHDVSEFQMAGLFERGLKKTIEAGLLKDETEFKRRWGEGRANLEQFLSLATTCGATNYGVLPERNLQEDLWATRVILGDGAATSEEIPGQDAASREKFKLLCALLYPKIQPDRADQNLQRMTNFLHEFPQSRSRPRVEFEMADVALCEGERLVAEAWRTGDAKTVAAKRPEAAIYLDMAGTLFSGVIEDKEGGIADADVQESQVAMLRVFFAKEDWAGLSDWAAHLVADWKPGEKVWIMAKLYDGAGLTRQRRLTEAAGELDAVLATGFKNNPSYDGHLVSAARWRIRVARESGDEAAQRRVAEQVENSNCYDSIKRTFVKDFRAFLAQPNPVSQK